MNPMEQVHVSKVVVNIGVGDVGQPVEKAMTLLHRLTGQQPVKTKSRDASRTFGKRPGLEIGVKTTLRGDDAEAFLERVFQVKNEIPRSSITEQGNISLGIEEYLDMPGVEYDPDIGMSGFDVTAVLERPGYRVKKRSIRPAPVGDTHKVTQEDAVNYLTDRFEVTVT